MQKSHLLLFPVSFFFFVIRQLWSLRQVYVSFSETMETSFFLTGTWLADALYDLSFNFVKKTNLT